MLNVELSGWMVAASMLTVLKYREPDGGVDTEK
jgi:hypothetical protein